MIPSAESNPGALILVVDDSSDILLVVTRALTKKGYRVCTATNGREALHHIEAERPRLILLDMSMPVMNGWEFVREFRNRYGRGIPIVVMTAKEDSTVRCNEVGADAHVGKPLDLTRFYEVVEDTTSE